MIWTFGYWPWAESAGQSDGYVIASQLYAFQISDWKINISKKSRNKGTTKAKMLWSAGATWLNRRRAHGQGKHSAGKTLPDYTSRTVLADQTPPIDCLFRGLIRWTGVSACLQRHVALFVRHSTDVSRLCGLDALLSNTLWLTLASANWQVSAAAPSFFMRVFHARLKTWFCWPWY